MSLFTDPFAGRSRVYSSRMAATVPQPFAPLSLPHWEVKSTKSSRCDTRNSWKPVNFYLLTGTLCVESCRKPGHLGPPCCEEAKVYGEVMCRQPRPQVLPTQTQTSAGTIFQTTSCPRYRDTLPVSLWVFPIKARNILEQKQDSHAVSFSNIWPTESVVNTVNYFMPPCLEGGLLWSNSMWNMSLCWNN